MGSDSEKVRYVRLPLSVVLNALSALATADGIIQAKGERSIEVADGCCEFQDAILAALACDDSDVSKKEGKNDI